VKSLRIKETKEIFHQRSLIVSGRRHVRFTVASARQRYDMEIVREIVAERGIDPSRVSWPRQEHNWVTLSAKVDELKTCCGRDFSELALELMS
jgi:hypothetical protein